MTEQQAMNWYYVDLKEKREVKDARVPKELREPEPSWFDLTERRRDVIRSHVRNVLEGEIPRSKMEPADLAIYFGRYRTVGQAPPESFLEQVAMDADAMRITRRCVWWDCLELHSMPMVRPSSRLFGNANIGNLNLTNLQVAGQLACDHWAYINGWHLILGDDDELPFVERLLANATATLIIGDMPQARRRLVELWREPLPLESTIPPRQCFNVQIDFFGKVFQAFIDYLFTREKRDPERDPFRLWINLEGWESRCVW